MNISVIICVLFFLPIACRKHTMYSEGANDAQDDSEMKDMMGKIKPFRMKKTNLLWAVARKKKSIPDTRREDLFKELENYDRLEVKLKKLKSEQLDQDGMFQEKVLHNLRRIADKYSLRDHLSEADLSLSSSPYSQEASQPSATESTGQDSKVYFEDRKLQEMWAQAREAGFSGENLALLKEEFTHQQMKIDEFNLFHNEASDVHDPFDNEISDEDFLSNSLKDDTKDQIIGKRRDRLAIADGYLRLEHMVATLSPADGEFGDARVNSLWNMARRSQWSEEKLESFKEELKHFEKRVNKQKVYSEQLQMSLQSLQHKKSPEKHQFIEDKHKLLNREIKKYHAGLKDRVTRAMKHLEL